MAGPGAVGSGRVTGAKAPISGRMTGKSSRRAASPRGHGRTMQSTALTTQERDAVAEAMRCALELHKQGILDQAEGLYAGVLKLAPDHVEALHFLGVLKNQQGHVEEALALTAAALELNSGWVDLLVNHALILN